MKSSSIEFKSRHDTRGVQIITDNDMVYVDVEKALEIRAALDLAIKTATEKGPDAPAPLRISGHNFKDDEYFADCGEMESDMTRDNWYGSMGHYELNYSNLHEIRNWCNDVMKYIRKKEQEFAKKGSLDGAGDEQ